MKTHTQAIKIIDTTIRERKEEKSDDHRIPATRNMAQRLRYIADCIESAPRIENIVNREDVGMTLYNDSLAVLQEMHPLDDIRRQLLKE